MSQCTIAVDLDGTLLEKAEYPSFGAPRDGAREAVCALRSSGYRVIVHTARPRREKTAVEAVLHHYGISIDGVRCGKLMADVYVDDRALDARSPWSQVEGLARQRVSVPFEAAFNPDEPRDEHGRWAKGLGTYLARSKAPESLTGFDNVRESSFPWPRKAAMITPSNALYDVNYAEDSIHEELINKHPVLFGVEDGKDSVEQMADAIHNGAIKVSVEGGRCSVELSSDARSPEDLAHLMRIDKLPKDMPTTVAWAAGGDGYASGVTYEKLRNAVTWADLRRANRRDDLSRFLSFEEAFVSCGDDQPRDEHGRWTSGHGPLKSLKRNDKSGAFTGKLYRSETGHSAIMTERYGKAPKGWGTYVTEQKRIARMYGKDVVVFDVKGLRVLGYASTEFDAMCSKMPNGVNMQELKDTAASHGWHAINFGGTEGIVLFEGTGVKARRDGKKHTL
jgi:hypothetical protein